LREVCSGRGLLGRSIGSGIKGVTSARGLPVVSLVSGLFMPRRKMAIISRASSFRLFFMVKLLESFLNLRSYDTRLRPVEPDLKSGCGPGFLPVSAKTGVSSMIALIQIF
jgi:hypothetical protein